MVPSPEKWTAVAGRVCGQRGGMCASSVAPTNESPVGKLELVRVKAHENLEEKGVTTTLTALCQGEFPLLHRCNPSLYQLCGIWLIFCMLVFSFSA